MQNSLLKFHDLQDFSAKMFIVADAVREREYNAKLGFSAFHEIAGRINFLNFERLVKLYELEMARQGDDFVL
jgi:hypothetical protein